MAQFPRWLEADQCSYFVLKESRVVGGVEGGSTAVHRDLPALNRRQRPGKAQADRPGFKSHGGNENNFRCLMRIQGVRRMGLVTSKRPVVLIVEDEFLLRMDAVEMIAAAGFEVVEAGNADEAIEILQARRDITVVFTDIQM